MLTQEA